MGLNRALFIGQKNKICYRVPWKAVYWWWGEDVRTQKCHFLLSHWVLPYNNLPWEFYHGETCSYLLIRVIKSCWVSRSLRSRVQLEASPHWTKVGRRIEQVLRDSPTRVLLYYVLAPLYATLTKTTRVEHMSVEHISNRRVQDSGCPHPTRLVRHLGHNGLRVMRSWNQERIM